MGLKATMQALLGAALSLKMCHLICPYPRNLAYHILVSDQLLTTES